MVDIHNTGFRFNSLYALQNPNISNQKNNIFPVNINRTTMPQQTTQITTHPPMVLTARVTPSVAAETAWCPE